MWWRSWRRIAATCDATQQQRRSRLCPVNAKYTKKRKMSFVRALAMCTALVFVDGFPDGAPVDACVKPIPNTPYHERIKPQPLQTNPYQVIASSDSYGPAAQITVTIQGSTNFKGFFIQARDVATNAWIGSWLKTPNTNIHPECSAITHADPKEKKQATFVWQAPNDIPHGNVYFTGTVLKEYSTFWSQIVNTVG